MIIQKISSNNFGPFKGEQGIDLHDGVYSVVCEYDKNPQRSNRGGKTSFVEIILYALYGEIRGGSPKEFIHTGEDELSASLVFDDGFSIQRSHNLKNSGKLIVEGSAGSSQADSQKIIDDKLGLGLADFLLSYYFKQSDIDAFFKAKVTERKKILSRWFEKEYWKIYEDKAKQRLAALDKNIDILNMRLSEATIEIDIEGLKNEERKSKEALIGIEKGCGDQEQIIKQMEVEYNGKTDVAKFKSELVDCQRQYADKSRQKGEYTENQSRFKRDLERKQKDVDDQQRNKIQLEQLEFGYKEFDPQIVEKCDKLRDEISKLSVVKKIKVEELQKIEKFGGCCPYTNEPCGNATNIDGKKIELQREIETSTTTISQYAKILDGYAELRIKANKASAEINILKVRIESCKSTSDDCKELQTFIDDCSSKIIACDGELLILSTRSFQIQQQIDGILTSTEVLELQNKINIARQALETTHQNQKQQQKAVCGLEIMIQDYYKRQDNIKTIKAELEACRKQREDLVFIVYMFSSKGIMSRQIENSIEDIETETNAILEKLGTNLQIEFQSERELTTWEDACVVCGTVFSSGRVRECPCGAPRERRKKDDLGVYVLEGETRRAYELDSGGGQTLICFAFRCAVAKLLQKNLNCKVDFIILDEILGALDDVNSQEVVNTILHYLQNVLGFRQIPMISHKKDVQDSGNVIEIMRYQELNYSTYGVKQ